MVTIESDRYQEHIETYFEALASHALGSEILGSNAVPVEQQQQHQVELTEFIQSDEVEKTSMVEKHKSNTPYTSFLAVYNDLKLAVATRLVQERVGSDKYVEISDLFKYAVDLLHREGQRVQENLQSDRYELDNYQDADLKEPSFEKELLQDVHQICADYNQWNGQAYFIMSQNGALFSSMNSKAPVVDPRTTETHGQFNTTEVVQMGQNNRTYRLGLVSRQISSIPHPSLGPAEILHQVTHPVESPLPTSRWLKFDGYSSYAPAKDNAGAIFDDADASAVWFDYFGNKKLSSEQEVQAAALKRIKELEKEVAKLDGAMDIDRDDGPGLESVDEQGASTKQQQLAPEDKSSTTAVASESNKQETSKDDHLKDVVKEENGQQKEEEATNGDKSSETEQQEEQEASTGTENSPTIDFESIFNWRPASFIDDDELEAAENGTEAELVSRLLLQLQQMQRVRLTHNDKTEYTVTAREQRLAFKIQNILTRILGEDGVTPSDLGIEMNPYLPVLQSVYNGSLPAPEKPMNPAMQRVRGTPGRPSKRR